MYRKFFGIEENPFSNTPDPKYLFMSPRHKEALAHLIYGVEGGSGFVLLTGEVGTGKTTLSRYLAEHLPANVDLALCLNPRLSEIELLVSICDDLGIATNNAASSIKKLTDAINTHLLDLYARNGRAVLIIDEAQNLRFELLEQVRMLTNLETTHNKLLQIILIGQSELKDYIDQPRLRQLSQRVTARYHLDPMTPEDSKDYIEHRLHVAGLTPGVFKAGAIAEITKQSRGIPRLINSISERCLLGAYATGKLTVSRKLAREAAGEVLGRTKPAMRKSLLTLSAGIVFGVFSLMFLALNPFALNLGTGILQSSTLTAIRVKLEQTPMLAPVLGPLIKFRNQKAAASAGAPRKNQPDFITNADPAARDHKDAMGNLFALWNASGTAKAPLNSCPLAPSAGLSCFAWHGTWSSLIAVNKPAFIELKTNNNAVLYAVVSKLDGRKVTLQMGPRQITATLDDLQPYHQGGFTVLWKTPLSYSRTLKPGMQGPDVIWVKRRLNSGNKALERLEISENFNAPLVAQINDFKASRSLPRDGNIGPLTFIHLSNLVGNSSTPTLHP